jgi:CBS domain-containing protein
MRVRIVGMTGHAGFDAAITAVGAANDEAQLRSALEHARLVVIDALTAHTPAVALATDWSQVMRRGVASAARLVGADEWGCTWFVSGSVGRGEAIPGSDVETMMALDDELDPDAKAAALDMAARAHAVLERCGVYPDDNGVLASRGRFCRRWSSWFEGIDRWCAEPGEDRGVVMTGLLADAVALGGGTELRVRTVGAAARHPAAARAMLQDATSVRVTIPSRLRVFATHADNVDVKQAALEPIVKIARWAAMSAASDAVSTLERLEIARAAGSLDDEDATSLRDCYLRLSRIRWRHRAGPWLDGRPSTDRLSLSEMSPQERATLREIGREVGGVRRKLAYLASTPSFR